MGGLGFSSLAPFPRGTQLPFYDIGHVELAKNFLRAHFGHEFACAHARIFDDHFVDHPFDRRSIVTGPRCERVQTGSDVHELRKRIQGPMRLFFMHARSPVFNLLPEIFEMRGFAFRDQGPAECAAKRKRRVGLPSPQTIFGVSRTDGTDPVVQQNPIARDRDRRT